MSAAAPLQWIWDRINPVTKARNRRWRGMVIPPAVLTHCGRLTDTPEKFHASACAEADRLTQQLGLNASSRLLDIGCGAGRLAIGLLARNAAFNTYLGIDVSQVRIEWCQRNLSPRDRRLGFQYLNMRNARYNPQGDLTAGVELPRAGFDIIYLYSVFSHLLAADVQQYLQRIARALHERGRCFATAFVADGVPPVTENPAGFGPLQWSGPLHCVLYSRDAWHEMLRSAGLAIETTIPEINIDGQTGYVLTRADAAAAAP
jgi:SAM-dependent methyltransferase